MKNNNSAAGSQTLSAETNSHKKFSETPHGYRTRTLSLVDLVAIAMDLAGRSFDESSISGATLRLPQDDHVRLMVKRTCRGRKGGSMDWMELIAMDAQDKKMRHPMHNSSDNTPPEITREVIC